MTVSITAFHQFCGPPEAMIKPEGDFGKPLVFFGKTSEPEVFWNFGSG
jgi:hypothetical protein